MPTQLLGVDYAWGRPNPKHLYAAGYRLVCRYLSNTPSKNLTAAERDGLLNAGEDIVVVWESTAGRALDGAAAGRADARRAVAQLRALGGPTGMGIYAAVDLDTTGPKVAAYFRGFREVVGNAGYRPGAYGSYQVVSYLVHEGLVELAWQTVAWSLGKVSAHADLYQREVDATVDGASVDIDVICHPDYGGWQGSLPDTHSAKKTHLNRQRTAGTADLIHALRHRKHGLKARSRRMLHRLAAAIRRALKVGARQK